MELAIMIIVVCVKDFQMARFMISEFFVVKWLRGGFKSGLFYQFYFTAYSNIVTNKYASSF